MEGCALFTGIGHSQVPLVSQVQMPALALTVLPLATSK